MPIVKRVLWGSALILATFFLHVAAVNFFPPPFNHIHVIIVVLLWLVFNERGSDALVVSLGAAFLMELISSATFGLHLFTLVATTLVVLTLAYRFFTTYSLAIVFFATASALTFYRLLFLFLLSINNLYAHQPLPAYSKLILDYIIEIGLSTALLICVYTIQTIISKRFNPRYIKVRFNSYDYRGPF